MTLSTGKKAPEMVEYLLTRRSCPLKIMAEPGPSAAQIETILKAASRVPDHGKLFPWYFIVITGDNRRHMGELLKQAWLSEEPEATEAKLNLEAERFLRAPVVIGVVSRMREGKKPLWEQILSAGAACHNLCLAANALGFGTNWLTEWYSYNQNFRHSLGLDAQDHVAGFIYIGTPTEQPEERDRPNLAQITTQWEPGVALNKGAYGHPEMGYPELGFDLNLITKK